MSAGFDQRIVWEGVFSLHVPESFQWQEEDGVISIFDAVNGDGALQVSFAKRSKAEGPSRDEVLDITRHFVTQQGWHVHPDDITVTMIAGCLTSVFSVVDSDGTSWRVWHILSRSRLATATYVVEGDLLSDEAQLFAEIVRSFSWD